MSAGAGPVHRKEVGPSERRGSGPRARLVETKTASSVGTIPLPHFAVERLRKHIEREEAARPQLLLSQDWILFTTEAGYAISGSW